MLIKRSVLAVLEDHLENEEISLIIGPRQSGKTTLMLQLIEKLEKEGKKHIYLNMDIEKDRVFFATQSKLVSKIKSIFGEDKGYVFLDEIQKKENAGVFLKGIFDMKLPYKFVVTGSGSIELKEKIYESLAGRKRVFEVFPLTFKEFVDYKTDYKYEKKLGVFFEVERDTSLELLREYMMFGGYPKVVLGKSDEEKRYSLGDIYKSFIEKDIQVLLKVEKSDSLTDLLKAIGAQSGRLTNYNELSNTLNISLPTVKKYLWYLEKTYIIDRSKPFFRNVKKEITKSPIFYFVDLGLRNYLLDIGSFDSVLDKGFLFQNFVFNQIKNLAFEKSIPVKFWRTKQGAEVDIVLDVYPAPIPIEVKYSMSEKIDFSRSFNSFIDKFKSKKKFMITLNSASENIISYYQLEKIL